MLDVSGVSRGLDVNPWEWGRDGNRQDGSIEEADFNSGDSGEKFNRMIFRNGGRGHHMSTRTVIHVEGYM